MPLRPITLVALMAAVVTLAACGSSKKATPASTGAPSAAPATTAAPTSTGAAALQAEAGAAATGDIPDNQVFLTYRAATAGFSMKYPEGWAQQATRSGVTFRDKNNIVRVVIAKAAAPSAATIRREVGTLKGVRLEKGPSRMTISGAPAFKVVYSTRSAANPVTGKRVQLVVDRYYLFHAGREAIVDLGTPKGVDNVDAYRLMIESFRWR